MAERVQRRVALQWMGATALAPVGLLGACGGGGGGGSDAASTGGAGGGGASTAAGSFLLAAGHSQGYLSPVITYPRPDAETSSTSRHRVNYPGQPYRIPVVVAFGAWPFLYEIQGAPAGMRIGSQLQASGNELVAGADYGVITWPHPTDGIYPITVTVTDQNSVVLTVSFTLTVSATDWVFLNPQAATNGSGSLASPFNTLAALAGLTTKMVLVRAGTVDWEQKTVGLHAMPKTWLPYAQETVTMLQANSSIGGNQAHDQWFSSFRFEIPSSRTAVNQFFRLEGGSRIMFFENRFDGASLPATNAAPENLAMLMWTNQNVALGSTSNSWYPSVIGNAFANVRDRDLLLGYSMRYTVIENNSVENSQETPFGRGFYPKINVSHLQFRRNRSVGQTNQHVLLRIDAYAGQFPMDYFDVSYNSYRFFGSDSSGDGIGVVTNRDEFASPNITHRYFYRNTLYAGANPAAGLSVRGLNGDTVLTVSNNLLIGDGTHVDEVWTVQYGGSISSAGNVVGQPSSNMVDSDNKLMGVYVSHLGQQGAQVA